MTGQGVATVKAAFASLGPDASTVTEGLLEIVPQVVDTYGLGNAALAADWYDDLRAAAAPGGRFTAEPVLRDRSAQIEAFVRWGVSPLFGAHPDPAAALERVTSNAQKEIARPYRDTITTSSRRDPASPGWRRVASGGCNFCQMLAGRGAVYRSDTARFASHKNCHCSAEPVFRGQVVASQASTLQYVASQKRRSPQDQARLRAYLAAM